MFGASLSDIHVIEFQKRGLPHAHILFILDRDYKPRTAEDIDCVLWAEIRDPTVFPLLFETIVKFNIHSPCGLMKPERLV